MKIIITICFALLLLSFSCNGTKKDEIRTNDNNDTSKQILTDTSSNINFSHYLDRTKNYEPVLIGKINHEPGSFTQGLMYYKGYLYESTGLMGESSLRKLDTASGKVLKKISVSPEHFAEGLTIQKNKIYQLTWLSNLCFVYDLESFNMEGSFSYYGEGWGITNFNSLLILSDGSNVLKYINPDDFQVVRQVSVFDGNNPVKNLNELEMINGELFANIWTEDKIARIDPLTGNVIGYFDFSFLRKLINNENVDVFNGIAYNAEKDIYYVTGKYWPYIFKVKLVEKSKLK
ncbi:MAG: glutaminyl-peptide cyclotransferase [Ignavibacteriae bacterium]|nr:glutaminyl-peptide cyclotransferase [Ignavibacteriota bacterium]